MKKGTVTRWKRPLAAALGALFVLSAVCGAGSMLPAGVKDALPEGVREVLAPVTAQAAGGDPAMTQEAGVLRTGANTDNAQTVYYAGKPWRVIGYGATDGNAYARKDDMLTLFSADNLKTSQFNPYNNTIDCNDYGKNPENTLQPSMLKATVDSLFNGPGAPFSDKEQRAVVERTLENGEYSATWPYSNGVSGNQTSGYLWPLSALEADSMNANLRKANGFWWLRSPGLTDLSAANVQDGGFVAFAGGFRVDTDFGVRPAFHLNLKSVIFTSAIEGGKSSGAVGKGALKQVGQNSGNEWKLTLLDDGTVSGLDGHTGFSAQCVIGAPGTQSPTSATVEQGKQVTLSYSGAKTTTNEYVSAILKDNTGNILYYGNLAKTENKDANSPTGGVPLTIPSTVQPGTYILGVFAEQFNGDKKTDYASKVSNISLTVTAQTHTVTVTGTGHGTVSPPSQSGAQNDTVTLTATPDTGYRFVRWEVTQAGGGSISNATANPATFTIGTADAVVRAVFEAITYTVAFNSNGGSGNMTPQTRVYDDAAPLTANTFTNGPFPFTGWNTDPNGSGTAYADKSTENLTNADGVTVTLYAMWNLAQITTNSLPDGTEGIAYSETLTTSGTTGTVTWALASSALPDGLSLDPSGTISGTPSKAGTYTFTLQATDSASPSNVLTQDYTIKISAKSLPAPTPSGSCTTGHATYQWSTVYNADEHNDGEMVYCCSSCGHVLYRVPISGYSVFNKNTMQKILDAPQGATISVSTRRWISFHRMVYQALADRPDVTLKISFLDGEYRGNRYSVTIPAGYDTLSLLNGTDYCGFLYLGSKFGLSPGE